MSINSGLFAGVAAVAAQSTAFAVISDNIANVNTVGFKDTTTQFQALVTQSLSTSASAGGVKSITQTDPIKQGLLQGTANSTDVAIDGNGFFVTNEAPVPGLGDEYLLTRAGNFIKDENDKLVNSAGFYLQGYATNGTGAIENQPTKDLLSSLETVDLSKFQRVAKVTENVELNINLNAAAADADPVDVTNLTVYDSQGNDYLLRLEWDKTATANIWDCVATLRDPAGGAQNIAETGTASKATGFRIEFNTDGTPKTVTAVAAGGAATTGATGTAATTTITFTAAAITGQYAGRAVDTLSFNVNFGNYGTSSGMTQYDAPYQTSLLNQDGNGPTDLERVSFDDKGLLTAVFSDGSSRPIYKLPIATVPAPAELEALSGNAYRITADSGEAVLNFATEGGAGRVSASALENSTVDIAGQFTDLIIAQRAYSAATKIITTGDELLEEITRVKR